MFALGLCYLNGWAMAASDGARKEQAEWPPHPDRVFMALAAAWFETGENPDEGAALRWLETLPPPAIAASKATFRAVVTSYVPVNDERVGRKTPSSNEIRKLRNSGLAVIPEHRSRQPRNFPVAIPLDPKVHFVWPEQELGDHRVAMERLTCKVTHVGHSASFTQIWVEPRGDLQPAWTPSDGMTAHRFRVPVRGRLDQLTRLGNQNAWIDYHDLKGEIDHAAAALKAMKQPPRVRWQDFPDVVLLAPEPITIGHRFYAAAKAGDVVAAEHLVQSLVSVSGVADVCALLKKASCGHIILVAAHARERDGFNAIPAALLILLADRLKANFDDTIVQTNVVGHTGADGYGRLARQAAFDGKVLQGQEYLMVDDFVGQGGTLANLRGYIEKRGGRVIGAVALTGKTYSAKLNPTEERIHELLQKHGRDFEKWWKEFFGHAFNCLTESEARYLARSPDVDKIRDRLAAAVREGGYRSSARSPREQRQHIRRLKNQLGKSFPGGRPRAPRRPGPARWQGYDRPTETPPDFLHHPVFDPRLAVLAIKGRRVSLLATQKLTGALRGLLMRECPVQSPPEWFSGHRADGSASTEPHLALVPLAYVGSPHADGGIMGIGLALPRALQHQEVGRCLEPVFRDPETGLPREDLRLFGTDWPTCGIELETRDRPPWNLMPDAWTRPSRAWASVTPVVLDRHFDGEDRFEKSAESVKDACERIGLPRPSEVVLHPVSLVEGVPHARDFPQLTRKSDGGRLRHTHTVIIFSEAVIGPVLVGAGRFRGYGFCRPMDRSSGNR